MKFRFIAIMALFVITGCNEKSPEEIKKQKLEMAEKNCTSGSAAFVYSKPYVTRRLRSPSTADFPFSDYTSNYLGDCTHLVSSYVDAQNGFGAVIRQDYTARMKYNKDSDSWNLLRLDMQ